MKNDIITIYDEQNNEIDYKVLMIIDKYYKYVIYTDKKNQDMLKNLYVAKVSSLDDYSKTLEIKDEEWNLIEEEYLKIYQS